MQESLLDLIVCPVCRGNFEILKKRSDSDGQMRFSRLMAAPIAHHYEAEEVAAWFRENEPSVIRSTPPLGDASRESHRRYAHSAITMLGQRSGRGGS